MYDYVANNFLALPAKLSDYGKAKAVVLPIPYDLTLSYGGGARLGPQAIIAASRQLETYDHELDLEPCEIGVATLPELEQVVSGPKDMQEVIYRTCIEILNDGKFVLSLGGEHSISAALVRAHLSRHKELSVLHIDAHSDLRDSYQGSPYSHACVMSRIGEMVPFVSVGIRSFSGAENERKYRDRIITPADFRKTPEKIENSVAELPENVYITVDLDAFDPSVMPAVGTPEPGGLSWDEIISIINIVTSRKKIVGADIVELSPRPGLEYADFTAAKLAYKLIAKSFFKG